MNLNAVLQGSFPFLAAANEAQRRAPATDAAPRQVRARRPRPMSADTRSFHPVHVTLRWLEHVQGARDRLGPEALEAAVRAAAAATREQPGFHLFHGAVRADGVHLLVQADSAEALAAGVGVFAAATARRLNRAMCRLGPVFADDYAVQALRSPGEFREALRFLIGRDA